MRVAPSWRALLFLWRRSLANRLGRAASRVRTPRYAAGFAAGLAYFGWMGWILLQPSEGGLAPDAVAGLVDSVAPPLLALFAAGWWISGRTHLALAFRPAEVAFLFQAPVSRGVLLDYKLLRGQPPVVALSLAAGLVLGSLLPLPLPLLWLAVWSLLTTAHLHQVASGLIRASWSYQGPAALRRHWLPLILLAAGAAGLALVLWRFVAGLAGVTTPAEVLWALDSATAHPGAALLVLPFSLVISPVVATSTAGWAVGMLGSLALLGLHYLWVHRIDAAFEELAAEAGIELQAVTSAFKEGRLGALRSSGGGGVRRAWFALGPRGHPAVAVLWKNFTAFTRSFGWTHVASLALLFVGLWFLLVAVSEDPAEGAVAAALLPSMLIPMALLLGPIFLRNDVRTDFARMDLVRTHPLSGRDLMAAEILASGSSLALTVLFLLTLSLGFAVLGIPEPPAWWAPWAAWGAGVLVLPPLCVLATGIQNLLAVLFPGWVEFGPVQPQGIDQTGHLLVQLLVSGLLLAVGLLVPVVFGAMLGARLYLVIGEAALWPALLGAWVTLLGEVLLMVVLLGEAYEEMDPSEAGLLG